MGITKSHNVVAWTSVTQGSLTARSFNFLLSIIPVVVYLLLRSSVVAQVTLKERQMLDV